MNEPANEHERIVEVYRKRDEKVKNRGEYFGYEDVAHVYRIHSRYFDTLKVLRKFGYRRLSDLSILDVGCGEGRMLHEFIQWGVLPENLYGIELRDEAVNNALRRNPGFNIKRGSATLLPWPDGSFDIVFQGTVFTSILDSSMRMQIASEFLRVLKPGGIILWYDYHMNNPNNPDVRRVRKGEIYKLFQGCDIFLKRITLAPPLARVIAPFSVILCQVLEKIPLLCTHYLGVFRKQ